ncbi:hypothetical protein, partial [Streptobacillus felis]
FEAEINGVKFNDEELYNSVEFILEQIEDKFGEVYNNDFVAALESTINNMYLKYENFSYGELENEFYYCISEAKEFNNLEFKYYGSDWKIETLNEGIKFGDYNKEKIKKWNNKKNERLNEILKEVANLFEKTIKENGIKDYDKSLNIYINDIPEITAKWNLDETLPAFILKDEDQLFESVKIYLNKDGNAVIWCNELTKEGKIETCIKKEFNAKSIETLYEFFKQFENSNLSSSESVNKVIEEYQNIKKEEKWNKKVEKNFEMEI